MRHLHLIPVFLVLPCLVQAAIFQEPAAAFISTPEEQVVTLLATGTKVSAAQDLLNQARREKPSAILVLRVDGPLVAEDAPLVLGERSGVIFAPGAGISATAPLKAMVVLAGSQDMFIRGGLFDGKGKAQTAVEITAAGRVNLDGMTIKACERGVRYEGRGANAWNESGSLTRSAILDTGVGLTVKSAARFVILDNRFRCRVRCVDLEGPGALIAGNRMEGGQVGLRLVSERALVAANTLSGMNVAMELPAGSRMNSLSLNVLKPASEVFAIGGESNFLFHNEWPSGLKIISGAGDANVLVSRQAPSADLAASGNNLLFFPPSLYTNHHLTVLPDVERLDLAFTGGPHRTNRSELAPVQEGIDSARASKPSAMLVVNLKGHFTAREAQGLRLPENAALILDGSIRTELSAEDAAKGVPKVSQVVLFAGKGVASMSGGLLDGNGQVAHGVNAPGKNVAVIDGVTVRGAAADGFMTKGHGGYLLPIFFRGCAALGSGGRGFWLHVTRFAHVVECAAVGNQMDGFDLDAWSHDGFTFFNQGAANGRHGIFVEEAVRGHQVFANELIGNGNSGVHVWNEEVKGNTGSNAIACNRAFGNRRGVSVGGRAADKSAHHNLFFNNSSRGNREQAMLLGNPHAQENYFGQSALGDLAPTLVKWGTPAMAWWTTPGD